MKIILALLLFLFFSKPTLAQQNDWVGGDKPQHFIVSMFAGALGNELIASDSNQYERIIGGALIGFAIGFAKEILDAHKPNGAFSRTDLVWDLLGSVVGSYFYDKAFRVTVVPNRHSVSNNPTVYLVYTSKF